MKTNLIRFALFALVMTFATPSWAKGGWHVGKDNVAVGGYDVVAYRTEARARKGTKRHSATFDGVRFLFATAENKKAFVAAPSKYLPKYNGYCAFAVAMKNAKVPADPKTFKFRDGELMLFFNDLYEGKKFNTKVPWNENEAKLKAKADANWRALARN